MPKRTDIHTILIIGSGPIVIGQACEFDYSGTQAIKALKKEGFKVILINSNPATIMTDPHLADKVYIEPLTIDYLHKVIKIENPDAILPTVGGQTALNLAMELHESGILKKYNIEMLGAKPEAIAKAEDRKLFKEAMNKIEVQTAKSDFAHNLEEALKIIKDIGFPCILRPSFTLGGAGGGICYKEEDFQTMILKALDASHNTQVLIEESILGWKEYELEVMRDLNNNVVIICSIENLDPMGVHTGDSITVAPQQTLTDKEYQHLRNLSKAIIKEIGVDTGGSNIQFAVNPKDGDVRVIEMNPRVSRSSALASKATGFPIAKIATKLAIGYSLDEISNDITLKTKAAFEPTIDYIVTKIPRFTFEKFPEVDCQLDTQMRSIGETMAIGRTFKESFQKALQSLENQRYGWGLDGFIDITLEVKKYRDSQEKNNFIIQKLSSPNDKQLFYIYEAFKLGKDVDFIYEYTKIDTWFLYQLKELILFEQDFINSFLNKKNLNLDWVIKAKRHGYSDRQLGYLIEYNEIENKIETLATLKKGSLEYLEIIDELGSILEKNEKDIREYRFKNNIHAVFKRVDTCAGEFQSFTPYLYSTYENECEAHVSNQKKVLILGSGPNRIGQGIEFDYCCCQASYTLQELGIESIMINSNPETVSTDYDTSDRLYFEPLQIENILEIYHTESKKGTVLGCILQFGGQTPLRLAKKLQENNIPILGTSSDAINIAEDRDTFYQFISHLNYRQSKGSMASNQNDALKEAQAIGYPILIRPSYVIGGRDMKILYNQDELIDYVQNSTSISYKNPVLIDQFLENAIEVDVDALCDSNEVYIAGIMEHIEQAGIHSGDSACVLPSKNLSDLILKNLKEITTQIALKLKIKGLINIQFAIKNDNIYIIEVNPRASRTIPFVSKATHVSLAKLATKVILGTELSEFNLDSEAKIPYYNVKEVVLPFKKFIGTDIILGPEMKSTGEVMGVGVTIEEAFYKSQLAAGQRLPKNEGCIFISVNNFAKESLLDFVPNLIKMGYEVIATKGTAEFLKKHHLHVTMVYKLHEGTPNIVNYIKENKVQFIYNIPTSHITLEDAHEIRQAAIQYNIPYVTTTRAASLLLNSLTHGYYKEENLKVYPVLKNSL